VSTLLQVSGPWLIALGIDVGLPAILERGDWAQAWWIVGGYLLAAIGAAILMRQYTVLAAQVSQSVLYELRARLYRHAQRLSLEFHESYTSGRIISRLTSDLEAIRELLDSGLNGLIRGSLFLVFTAIALLGLDWVSGLLLFV